MKYRRLSLSLFVLFFCFASSAIDISETLVLERFTILTNSIHFEHANGFLLKSGRFRVVTSGFNPYSFYGIMPDDLEPISGRPVTPEVLYDGYKAAGVIPKWVRSTYAFYVADVPYVIVSVKGGSDPNPVPVILEHPENERVLEGSTAFFSVNARPYVYLSYQWFFKKKPLPGATDDFLLLPNVTPAQTGIYTVKMNAGGKSVTTRKAMLQVVRPISIKAPPKSQTVEMGKPVTFRVTARGTGPFTYQWYYNANSITNATKSFYAISKVKAEDAGVYAVAVGNGLSSDVAGALLTVEP